MAAPTDKRSPAGFRESSELPLKLIRLMPAMEMRKPIKKRAPGRFSPRNRQLQIAVKNGAIERITPTLEASVMVRAMFSIR